MSNRRAVLFRDVLIGCDIVALIASFLVAYGARRFLNFAGWDGEMFPVSEYTWLLWGIIPTWLFFLNRFGLQTALSHLSPPGIVTGVMKVQVICGLVIFSGLQLSHSFAVSRIFLVSFLVLSAIALVGVRFVLAKLLQRIGMKRRFDQRHVLVIKNSARVQELLDLLENEPLWKSEVIGILSLHATSEREFCGKPVLGTVDSFAEVLEENVIDEVVAAAPSPGGQELSRIAAACVERGITFRTMISLPPPRGARPHLEALPQGTYLLSLEMVPQDPVALLFKRLMDLAGALVGLVALMVTYLWYRPKLRRESPGAVLFRQQRVGRNGRVFTLYKFRTMYPDAEKRLDELRAHNQMRGSVFKLRDDPRVLPTGRALRRRHLDELPQFWNVLKGDMSLVGTRPPTPEEVARYEPRHYRRLSMKPGITGLWQIHGNAAVNDFEEIVKLDCQYISSWSLWQDCRILARTVFTVVRGGGW